MPAEKQLVWETRLSSEGIGGIAATREWVVVGSRSLLDDADVFSCHRMSDGHQMWQIVCPAAGDLDYGNSPRATPLIVGQRVILLGAFGDLTVADLDSGEILWQMNFRSRFGAELPIWGFCNSPLALTGSGGEPLVVVQPGAAEASLVALNLDSGAVVWKSPGRKPGYSSLIVADINGQSQLVGYDETTAGGWGLDGKRLWTLTPGQAGDFNVPTPLLIDGRLFLTTENNGSRLYEFDADRQIDPNPVAEFDELSPDTHSPVLVGDLICGTSGQLYCLDKHTLDAVHSIDDRVFSEYTSAISDGQQRLLITTLSGDLVLLQIDNGQCQLVSRLRLTDDAEVYAHPALVDNRLLIRYGRSLECLWLGRQRSRR